VLSGWSRRDKDRTKLAGLAFGIVAWRSSPSLAWLGTVTPPQIP
jgi:hypothetical protein